MSCLHFDLHLESVISHLLVSPLRCIRRSKGNRMMQCTALCNTVCVLALRLLVPAQVLCVCVCVCVSVRSAVVLSAEEEDE